MPTFLIESYLATGIQTSLEGLAALGMDSDARHRWSLLLPDDEICFHVVDGASIDLVRAAGMRAGLRCDRVSVAAVIPGLDPITNGGFPCNG